MRALKVLEENYNKDPAFWVDVINSNADITTKKLANKKLLDLGIDSLRLDKIEDSKFEINFATVGAYENWLEAIDNKE